MKTVDLEKLERGDSDANVLSEGFAGASLQRVRTYYTFVYQSERNPGVTQVEFQLVTTSKDIHLRIGQLNEKARQALVSLLFRELETHPEGVMVVDGFNRSGLFATMTKVTKSLLVLNLSLAR